MSTASSNNQVNRPRSSNGGASRPSSRVNKPAVPVQQSRPTSRNVPPSGGGNSAMPSGDNSKRQIVGQYMLGKTIGEGTFGKVKLAVHMPTGEKVAVKILEKSRIKDSADVRRVNREIKILKKARHDNIIQLYEVLDTQHAIYLIMECAEGGEMFDFIVACKHVPEVQACKFFHQIVDGVDALHKNDITHRDLKPENLLLKASPDGWIVKVVDFGLSNTHEGNRLLSTACGSPCYAAPEMIAGKKYIGPLADIWSMGVILFALVCGFLPFEDANTSVLYKKILSGEYKTPKWISSEVKDLIRRILETDPRKRYTMADIRKHPWYTMVQEKDIPKEIVNVYEDEQTRTETMNQLAAAGVDTQAVLDGLASHACNSLTALYYLSEQKFRARRANQQKNNPNGNSEEVIPQTRSDLTNKSSPETQEVTSGIVSPTTNNPSQQQQQQPLSSVAVKQSPLYTNVNNNNPNASNPTSAIPALKPLPSTTGAAATSQATPYTQAPPLLQQVNQNKAQQQQSQQQQVAPANAAMPSLDYYMRTGLTLPIGNANNVSNNPTSTSNSNTVNPTNTNPLTTGSGESNSTKVKPILFAPKIGPGANAIGEIPKLNLNKPKPTIPPLQKPGQGQGVEPLTSQTARGPAPTVKIAGVAGGSSNMATNMNVNNNNAVPQSARAVLTGDTGSAGVYGTSNTIQPNTNPIDMGYEVDGRPGTRRSRGRSRGAPNEGNGNSGFDGPPQGLFDTVPSQQPSSYQPPIRTEQVTFKDEVETIPAQTSSSINAAATVATVAGVETAVTATTTTTATNGVAPVAPATIKPSAIAVGTSQPAVKAPGSAPRSGSATQAGRRGKHLVTSNAAPVTAAPPSVQRTGSSSSKNSQIDSRQEAARNKLNAQGTFNISAR